jgi:hypothetical protein
VITFTERWVIMSPPDTSSNLVIGIQSTPYGFSSEMSLDLVIGNR